MLLEQGLYILFFLPALSIIPILHKDTVIPVFSDHITQDICFAFQTGGCLLLHESRARLHSAISNHLSIAISMSPEWVIALNRFNCTVNLTLCLPVPSVEYLCKQFGPRSGSMNHWA